MAPIYFGFKPRDRQTTKLAIKTDRGDLEPAEPSRIRIYSQKQFIPTLAMVQNLIGLMVAILTYPINTYIHSTAPGLMARPPTVSATFNNPGLAVVLKKGASLPTEIALQFEERGFTTLSFSGRTIWVHDNANKQHFLLADSLEVVDPLGPSPARYLNTHSFRAYLTLLAITTNICKFFHFISQSGSGDVIPITKQRGYCEPKEEGWTHASDTEEGEIDEHDPLDFTFKDPKVWALDLSYEKPFASLMTAHPGRAGIATNNSFVVRNSVVESHAYFFEAGDSKMVNAHGLIFKFKNQLALPDPNLIGDVLGRRFMSALGDSFEEQVENLELLKSGLSALRLTKVGDELTHLYKCMDIAIDCYASCVPIFTGSRYEGAIILGGPGSHLFVNGESIPFLPAIDLKQEMLTVSEHSSALAAIASHFENGVDRKDVLLSTSLVGLREKCLKLEVTQDKRDDVIRHAANLDFGQSEWVISPSNLKRCFDLMSNFSTLNEDCPIGRLSLFSKDPVLVSLSCFGEKTAPSWDIPNGTSCSLKGNNPPTPPTEDKKRKGKARETSDAAWVMTIRQTDLFSSVEEFRKMAHSLVYRSSSSTVAKKVGNRTFGRERMAEFWGPMREAIRRINPNALFEKEETLKRSATESSSVEHGKSDGTKKRRLGF